MVIVDENIDVRPRLAALVTNSYVHLRIPAGNLGQQPANVVRTQRQLPAMPPRIATAEQPQRLRNRDANLGYCGFHRHAPGKPYEIPHETGLVNAIVRQSSGAELPVNQSRWEDSDI
jgi:hypothetical protein